MVKIWIGNPDCYPHEQYKYGKLNGLETTYEEDAEEAFRRTMRRRIL